MKIKKPIVVKKRQLNPETIKQAKELSPESLQNAALRAEKLLQTTAQSQATEFDEWE
jgi:hypothetical protein